MNTRNFVKIIIVLIILTTYLHASEKKLIIYDPLHHHGINFYNTVQSLYQDSISLIFDLDSTIYNSDALFIFLSNDTNEYILSVSEGDTLITYINNGNHIYIYSYIESQDITNVAFWPYIGIQSWGGYPVITHVDSVIGIQGTFTGGIVLPHEFDSGSMFGIGPGCYPILNGIGPSAILPTAYGFDADSAYAVIDLFNEIFFPAFLERVLIQFDLIEPNFIGKEQTVQIEDFMLYQNYPNPFNASTTISFRLNNEEKVQLMLYNSLGEEIKTLISNQKLSGGIHNHHFDFSFLSSGIYYYKLKVGYSSQIRKMLLVN